EAGPRAPAHGGKEGTTVNVRLRVLLGAVVLVGALSVASPILGAQADLPAADGLPGRARGAALLERWTSLTDEERATLQDAWNDVLEARVAYLRQLVQLGLIPEAVGEARIQRITAWKEAVGRWGRPRSVGPPWPRMGRQDGPGPVRSRPFLLREVRGVGRRWKRAGLRGQLLLYSLLIVTLAVGLAWGGTRYALHRAFNAYRTQ